MTLQLVLGSGEKLTADELADRLEKGGLSAGKKPEDFDQAQIKAGAKVEMEHTKDPKKAQRIAMDHLTEDPKYYTKLARMEAQKSEATPDKTEQAIRAFLKKNPKPDDHAFHALAEKLGMEPDDLEEKAYAMLGRKVKDKAPKLEKGELTAEKAKKILKDGEVNGKPLTDQQKKFFGAIAGGETPLQKAERSLQAPKEWWGKIMTETQANPKYKKYKKDRLRGIVGGIWAGLDEKKKKEIRNRYGKEYGAAPENAEKSQDPQSPEEEERLEAEKEKKKDPKPPPIPGVKKSGIDGLADYADDASPLITVAELGEIIQAGQEYFSKADDGKPGESLGETSTKELAATLKDIVARLKGDPEDAAALQKRREAIKAELGKRTGPDFGGKKAEKSELPADVGALQADLEKCMVGSERGRGILEWADQFYNTPWHLQALQCIKDRIECKRKQQKMWKDKVPYQDRRAWSGARRGEYEVKREKENEQYRKESDVIQKRLDDLEAKLIDYRLDQEKAGAEKSGVAELDDFAKAKYTKRTGTPGNYRYEYAEPGKGVVGGGYLSRWEQGQLGPEQVEKLERTLGALHSKLDVATKELDVSFSEYELAAKKAKKFPKGNMLNPATPEAKTVQGIAMAAWERANAAHNEVQAIKESIDRAHTDALEGVEKPASQKPEKGYAGPKGTDRPAIETRTKKSLSEWIENQEEDDMTEENLAKAGEEVEVEVEEEATEQSGLDDLAGFAKAQALPEGKPKQKLGQGAEQGGKLAGVGKTDGDNTSGGGPGQDAQGQVKAPASKKDKLSDDDADEEGQMKTHKKPIESARKSMASPANQRDMAAQEQAAATAQLKKGEEDVEAGNGTPAEPEKEPELEKGRVGRQGMVEYSEESDLAVERLQKSKEFYTGGAPQAIPFSRPIGVGKVCPKCNTALSKSLSACPECGLGTVVHRVVPGGEAQGDHDGEPIVKSRAGKLRPRIEKDITIEK